VQGTILGARARADGRIDLKMTVEIRGRTVKLVGTGRLTPRPSGPLEATGDTLVDPRAFGLPLPPLVNLMVHVRWRIALTPANAGRTGPRPDDDTEHPEDPEDATSPPPG
jgi:hypothetical protein